LGNLSRGEHGERNLVKQGLKSVVVAAIDHRDIDGEFAQCHSGIDAGKTSADNSDSRSARSRSLIELTHDGANLTP
jgi:hypothetical protein